jgi:hypothetical protein
LSTHEVIDKYTMQGLADPDYIAGQGVRIEVNVSEFVWTNASDVKEAKKEAIEFLDQLIQYAIKGKRKLRERKRK